MREKRRPDGDTSGLTAFWLMAGMGTAMITGHLMLRLMQRMQEAGGPAGMMMKGPFGAAGWMFDVKTFDAGKTPEVTPPAAAPKPARTARPMAEDAEIVAPKLRLVEAGETMAAATEAVTEAWTKAAKGAVEAALDAGDKMVAASTEATGKTEAPVEAPAEVIPEAPAALAEILEPEAAGDDAGARAPETAAEPLVPGRPTALAAAEGAADDLKRIKGVGPKLEAMLNGLGYFHFRQIAAWAPEELAAVDEDLGGFSGRATRGDWIAQAKLLASDGETD